MKKTRAKAFGAKLALCALLAASVIAWSGCSNGDDDDEEDKSGTGGTGAITKGTEVSYTFGSSASSGTAVKEAKAYSDDTGYGFIFESSGTVNGNNVSSDKSFQFLAKVENKNYEVTVVTSATEVLSEVLPESFTYIVDTTGKTGTYKCADSTGISRTVTANKASTFQVAVCDGIMNLQFVLPNGASTVSVTSVSYTPLTYEARPKPYLIAIGDSTAYNNSSTQCSWGPAISNKYVSLPSKIGGFINCAMGGATAISIYNGGVHNNVKFGITEALLNVHPGDYVTINIGINNSGDSRSAQIPVFENYCVEGVKQRGGIPVIATITPRGESDLVYTTDTVVTKKTSAGGKTYNAGETIPAGTWHNSRHDNTYNKNLLTIAANYNLNIIDPPEFDEEEWEDGEDA